MFSAIKEPYSEQTEQFSTLRRRMDLDFAPTWPAFGNIMENAFLRFNPASFDHMDHVAKRIYTTGKDRHGRDAGARSQLFSGNKDIQTRGG